MDVNTQLLRKTALNFLVVNGMELVVVVVVVVVVHLLLMH
jgi:hypothetical protein